MRSDPDVEDLLRELVPQVLGVLIRKHGRFEECEDAVQDAVLGAAVSWPVNGVPTNPRGWLITAASRRLIDQIRSDRARRARETQSAVSAPEGRGVIGAAVPDVDDTLALLFMCCHPVLTPASQMALTLRAVGGLTTAEIARAFLVPDGTMAVRISRAKQRIKAAGSRFSLPAEDEWEQRLRVVLHVLYLIFNEGYTTSSGDVLRRADLCHEALRLTYLVRRQLPEDGEVAGLLALMLLTESRRSARSTAGGDLIPLAEQDRTQWDRELIDEGTAMLEAAMAHSALGPYQLQAAIAAIHAEAVSAEDTDWAQVHILYTILGRIAPNPMVTLNHAVAIAELRGPQAGLELLVALDADARISGHHRLHAVRAHLLEKAGDVSGAYSNYTRAARVTASLTERRYLESRACQLANTDAP